MEQVYIAIDENKTEVIDLTRDADAWIQRKKSKFLSIVEVMEIRDIHRLEELAYPERVPQVVDFHSFEVAIPIIPDNCVWYDERDFMFNDCEIPTYHWIPDFYPTPITECNYVCMELYKYDWTSWIVSVHPIGTPFTERFSYRVWIRLKRHIPLL